ncbi:hypothetical protein B0H11DRAFT_1923867 [Mycena galericulata]|nr:hypothetical protein B0H11DRAFT_1923867 [Mycena galericulata]
MASCEVSRAALIALNAGSNFPQLTEPDLYMKPVQQKRRVGHQEKMFYYVAASQALKDQELCFSLPLTSPISPSLPLRIRVAPPGKHPSPQSVQAFNHPYTNSQPIPPDPVGCPRFSCSSRTALLCQDLQAAPRRRPIRGLFLSTSQALLVKAISCKTIKTAVSSLFPSSHEVALSLQPLVAPSNLFISTSYTHGTAIFVPARWCRLLSVGLSLSCAYDSEMHTDEALWRAHVRVPLAVEEEEDVEMEDVEGPTFPGTVESSFSASLSGPRAKKKFTPASTTVDERAEGWLWQLGKLSKMTDTEMEEWSSEAMAGDRVQWFRAEAEMQRWQEQGEQKLAEL